jgi:undecaprenyl-phosphate galactose phosphotransferase/putative colanic acid biosynthesis UDP-glucose lipid carrier transferase
MSVGSDISDKLVQLEDFSSEPRVGFSSDAIPYFLPIADAFVILLSCIAGGVAYQLSVGNPMPDILPHCAIGLLASIIYILRMSGNSYYDFPDSAKPRVEKYWSAGSRPD